MPEPNHVKCGLAHLTFSQRLSDHPLRWHTSPISNCSELCRRWWQVKGNICFDFAAAVICFANGTVFSCYQMLTLINRYATYNNSKGHVKTSCQKEVWKGEDLWTNSSEYYPLFSEQSPSSSVSNSDFLKHCGLVRLTNKYFSDLHFKEFYSSYVFVFQ